MARLMYDDDDSVDLLPCPHCRRPMPELADKCPHCGDWVIPGHTPGTFPRWIVITALLLLFAISAYYARSCRLI
jgi:hypothetical protein